MEELYFGYKKASKLNALLKRRASPKRRRASPKRRRASPKRKLTKKMLDSLSLVKLKKLAKKYKVSCYKKGTKVCVKKSTLLKRLKSSRSINKILLSASKMRKEKKHKKSPKRRRRSRFGMKTIRPNVTNLSTPMTLSSGMTYKGMLDHYTKIPSTLLSYNMQSNGGYSAPGKSVYRNKNPPVQDFRYNPRLLGTSSMPSYTNISKPKSKFGQYFR